MVRKTSAHLDAACKEHITLSTHLYIHFCQINTRNTCGSSAGFSFWRGVHVLTICHVPNIGLRVDV